MFGGSVGARVWCPNDTSQARHGHQVAATSLSEVACSQSGQWDHTKHIQLKYGLVHFNVYILPYGTLRSSCIVDQNIQLKNNLNYIYKYMYQFILGLKPNT